MERILSAAPAHWCDVSRLFDRAAHKHPNKAFCVNLWLTARQQVAVWLCRLGRAAILRLDDTALGRSLAEVLVVRSGERTG